MRRVLTSLFCLILGANFGYSQISRVGDFESNMEQSESNSYDSLHSISPKNVYQHIGQEIFLKENETSKLLGWYALLGGTSSVRIHTKPTYKFTSKDLYEPVECFHRGVATHACSYDKLKSRTFKIVSILQGNGSEAKELTGKCLVMVDTESKETLYLYFSTRNNPFDSFITIGYYEKLKRKYVGNKYWFNPTKYNLFSRLDLSLKKLNGGYGYTPLKNQQFLCSDVSLKADENDKLIVILNDTTGCKYYTTKDGIERSLTNGVDLLLTEEKRDSIFNKEQVKKDSIENAKTKKESEKKEKEKERLFKIYSTYGSERAAKLANREVELGYTTQMCKDALGDSRSSNTKEDSTGVHTAWFYDSLYLFFRNDTLISKNIFNRKKSN